MTRSFPGAFPDRVPGLLCQSVLGNPGPEMIQTERTQADPNLLAVNFHLRAQVENATGKTRPHSAPAELARAIRKGLASLARKLARHHCALFAAYRKRAGQFLTALLPP
jgi:hypothetical protein